MNRHRAISRPRLRGFTMIEMVMSLMVLGIITTAAGALIVLSARMWPGRAIESGAGALSAALGQMAEDLAQATTVNAVAANWVQFVVPDRDGDGRAETVVYSWSGKAGDPLLRQLSGYRATPVSGPLDSLLLTAATRQETAQPSGTLVQSASTTLFDANAPGSGDVAVSSASAWGYVLAPTLPAGTVSWSIDRVRLRVRSSFSASDSFRVRVHAASGTGLPSGAILADVVVLESALSSSMSWHDVPITVSGLPAGASVAVCLIHASGSGESCRLAANLLGPSPTNATVVSSTTGGSVWVSQPSAALAMRVFGTTTSFSTPAAATTRLGQIAISARASGAAGRAVTQAAILRNRPALP